jgi:TolB-like protein
MKQKSERLSSIVIVLISILMCSPLLMRAQDASKIRLAIINFTTTSQEPEHTQLEKVVPEWLTTFFVKKQTFDVIERRQLEAILQEQTLGQTGLLDEQSAAQVGQVLGVDVLVTGSIISIADTLEVTARAVDTNTGTILGIANVVADDVEELREEIDTLGKALMKAISPQEIPEDAKMFETFDGEELNTDRWDIQFEDSMTAKDQEATEWWQEEGSLRLTGTYRKEDENRATWIHPDTRASYSSVEVKFRISELEGEVEVCVGASWTENDDAPWTGICPYFSVDYNYISIFLEDDDDREEELEETVRVGRWYWLRLQAADEQLEYYLDGNLLTTFSPSTPVDPSEGFWADISVFLPETQTVTVEFDEVILR